MSGSSRVYGEAAKRWRDAGWLGVLPLPVGRKSPPPDGFTGRNGRDPTEAEVARWVERFPEVIPQVKDLLFLRVLWLMILLWNALCYGRNSVDFSPW